MDVWCFKVLLIKQFIASEYVKCLCNRYFWIFYRCRKHITPERVSHSWGCPTPRRFTDLVVTYSTLLNQYLPWILLGKVKFWGTWLIMATRNNNLLAFLDICMSLFFVGPFTVLYWRGTFVSLYNFFISGNNKIHITYSSLLYYHFYIHQFK